jgi:hypothetical protein
MIRYVTEYAMGVLEGIDRERAVEAADAAEDVVAEGPHPRPERGVMHGEYELEERVVGGALEEVAEDTGGGWGSGQSKAKIERVVYGPAVGEIEDL